MRKLVEQLTSVPLQTVCDEPWDAMNGDETIRHCGRCDRDVFAISEMTVVEAELRLLNAEGTPCIRYVRNLDGDVLHRLAPRVPSSPSRSLAVASAIVALAPAVALAEPAQCVVLEQPSASAPAVSLPGPGVASAPAPAPPAAPPVSVPLGGAPPPPQQRVPYGTLVVKSKKPRELHIGLIVMHAPVDAYRLTPGDFVLQVASGKKWRSVKVHIDLDRTTTIDLDKR